MKAIISILIIIIIGLSGWIYLKKPEIVEKERIIKVIDYQVKTDTITLIRPAVIDTQIIIKKYFEKINYQRTFKVGDYKIQITDTLYYNSLHLGDLHINYKPRINYYLLMNYSPITGIGAGLAVQKNRFIYSLNYQPFSKNIQFGIAFRINK